MSGLEHAEKVPVHLDGVTKRFGDVVAVNRLTLTIAAGKITTLLGPSGCGKTTTLRMLAGFYIPDEGEVHIGDERVTDLPPYKRPTRTVFQNYALFPHMSVFENIAFGLRIKKISKSKTRERVEAVMDLVGLTGLGERAPGQLSGGQQQRVALARAIVLQPKVLLLDEPLSNLDAKLRVQMRDEIRSLQQRVGITTIYVTHDQSEAMSISDEVAIMHNGRLQQVGPPQEIYRRPATTFVAGFIGRANFIDSKVLAVDDSEVTLDFFGSTSSIPQDGYEIQQGDDVVLIIRPEAIHLSDGGDGFPGKVERATYLGSSVEYVVNVAGQSIGAVDYESYRRRIFREGEDVVIRFDRDGFHLLKKDETTDNRA